MSGTPQPHAIISFGHFAANLHTRELRKHGVTLRLPGQSFQILAMLLNQPGELVTREQIQSALWPLDTHVDFERGVNAAVNRLREALGDSAVHPIFIETLSRRGYRFIAPLSVSANTNSEPALAIPREQIRTNRLPLGALVTGGVALLLVICASVWYARARPPTFSNLIRISNDGKAKLTLNLPVTDGAHLYFIEGAPWTTGSGIAQMSVAGGEITWIATTLQDVLAIYAISPDLSELLVAKGVAVEGDSATGRSDLAAELWVQPLPAGTPHRVGNIYASAACWTPDGGHLIYATGQSIAIANKDGSNSLPLANVSGIVRLLRFSPDGRRIRFSVVHSKSETSSIWEMAADGTGVRPLFPDWKVASYQSNGDWSPDGDYYYFQAGRGNTQAIWVMPEHLFLSLTTSPSILAAGPLLFSGPVPSNDGKRLFLVGEEPRVELFRYDMQSRSFAPFLPGLSAGPVDFSHDRKWMAYVSYPDMNLWRSRLDGSEKMQLTFPPVRAYQPRWSPDDSTLAFMDVEFSRPWKIRLLSASGGHPELLVPSPDADADPTWTPDGSSIVFGKSNETDKMHNAIYRLDLKTRNLSFVPDSAGFFSPRLSPDGLHISALTQSQKKLMLFDTHSNQWSTLLEGEEVSDNEWSHDGKFIYLRENRGGAGEVVRFRLKDGVVERVLNLKDFPQIIDIFAAWIGLTPDDSPLLMRDRSVQEIYALDLRFH
jgi:Tol biopolymer transport system component/DNA-binding winged helix-turn-helix (wHTH) protein